MKLLIERGADENSIDCYGETSLHIAVVNGFKDIVKFLLEETRIDINAANT